MGPVTEAVAVREEEGLTAVSPVSLAGGSVARASLQGEHVHRAKGFR